MIKALASHPRSTPHHKMRMYAEQFPERDDVVMCKIVRITETGVYAHLLEYDNFEGLITLDEISKRRRKNVLKEVRLGKQTPMVVLRIDQDKGYVDLSIKRVLVEERAVCVTRFAKSKTTRSVLERACMESEIDLSEAYRRFGWQMCQNNEHALDALESVVADPELFLRTYDVPSSLVSPLKAECIKRFTIRAEKLQCVVSLACLTPAGIDAIKASAAAGIEASPHVKITIQAPPLYCVSAVSAKTVATTNIQSACAVIEKTLLEHDGEYRLVTEIYCARKENDVCERHHGDGAAQSVK